MRSTGARGFTIVEVLVLICIIGVLSGFTVVSKELIRKAYVTSITKELYADLQLARMNAITQGGLGFGIRFESPTSYVLFQFNDCDNDHDYDADACDGSREETVIFRKSMPASVVLTKTNQATSFGNEIVIFDQFGIPRRTNWGLGMMTILVRNEPDSGSIKCVSISMNRVKEASWNGSSCI